MLVIMKKRIALITNNWTPYSGGVVSSLRVQIDALKAAGHEVCLITLDFTGNNDDAPYVKRIPVCFRFIYKTNHMAVPWGATSHILQLLRTFQPDIIHVHHPFLLGVSGVKVARILKVPVVFTYHSEYESYAHYVPLPGWFVRMMIKHLVNSFCKTVDGIVAPSSAIKEEIEKKGITKPITIISSALQPIFLHTIVPTKRNKDRFELVCVSRFAQEKNITFLLDVYAALSPIQFGFTLAGYGYAADAIQEYAYSTLQLSKQDVLFINKPTPHALVQLYTESDLFLFAAEHETQALVLAEAMAAAVPVVSLDGAGQRDIIENGVNGFIVHNKQEMIETVQKIAREQELYSNLSKNAWQTAKRYTPECMAKKLVSFYNQFI